jgi:hypothetical protein
MKRCFFFLLVLQHSILLCAFEIGVDIDQTTIFHEKTVYAPESTSVLDTSFFVRHSFHGEWNYLNIAPMITIHTDTPYFGFYELEASFFINNISLSLGKNNFYFGDGISENFFFPVTQTLISNNKLSKQKFWNFRLNTFTNMLALSLGYIVDTENIDNYEVPEWHSVYGVVDYSRESFTLALESDARFTADSGIEGKTAFAFKFLFDNTFSAYNTISYKYTDNLSFKDSFSIIIGVSKYYSLHPVAFTAVIESFYADSSVSMAFYQNIEYIDLVLTTGISASRDLLAGTNTVKPQTTLAWYISNFNFEISYTFGNILSEDVIAGSALFLGVKYALN